MSQPTFEECTLGPVVPEVCALPIIAKVGGLVVHLVDGSVPFHIRHTIAHIAMVAQRSMSKYPAGYDGTVTEDDQRLYVLATHDRAVGFVLTALDDRFWRLSWKADGTIKLIENFPLLNRGPKVARIWVAAKYREKGLSAKLVEISSQDLSVEVSALGWELPLTFGGAALVRRIAPSNFLGCGDLSHVCRTRNLGVPQKSAT